MNKMIISGISLSTIISIVGAAWAIEDRFGKKTTDVILQENIDKVEIAIVVASKGIQKQLTEQKKEYLIEQTTSDLQELYVKEQAGLLTPYDTRRKKYLEKKLDRLYIPPSE